MYTLSSLETLPLDIGSTAGIPDGLQVLDAVGTGAFGKVFLVQDRATSERVALKRLERAEPASVYRFKQEFRALADVKHPNLVRLHELFNVDGTWSFSMDYVDGVRFDTWVRGLDKDRRPSSVDSTRSDETDESADSRDATALDSERIVPASERASAAEFELDEGRLREALKQLVDGVLALHASGILHRDLKPSNVLVDGEGRVVILDFGLAATSVEQGSGTHPGRFGTPAYMSPEQARGGVLTMASDWYAVGVMLYEALTGQLPFVGSASDMLAARVSRDPRPAQSVRAGMPSDLTALADALLNRNPTARPNGFQIAQAVGLDPAVAVSPQHVLGGAFVGRAEELNALERAFDLASSGKTVVAHVHGASGYGKTTLVRRFLAALGITRELVVLEGRCYERESMPFKALDDLVDALGRYMQTLPAIEAAALLPRDSRALVRLFPSLGRLDVMTSLPGRAAAKDPQELRRRAFRALRDMFARLTDSRPVVLFIDDVHWGDDDSAQLIRNLLAPPDVPPLLLIVGYRKDQSEGNELLAMLRNPVAADAAWETVDVPVGRLSDEEAQNLAMTLAMKEGNTKFDARIARESGGSPLLISEIARYAITHSDHPQTITLSEVVAYRVATLPAPAQKLLYLIACSERPLAEPVLALAGAVAEAEIRRALELLRDERLVSVTHAPGGPATEMLHDKLRRAVRESLGETQRMAYHAALADALERSGAEDLQSIAHHHESAGALKRARLWWERAADRAATSLAFDRAVRLYRRACAEGSWDETLAARRKLADALVHAGRGPKAAEVFLQLAARATDEADARRLKRNAAEQYLRAGHVAEAQSEFGLLVDQLGIPFPRTPTAALTRLVYNRTRLKWRGFKFVARKEDELSTEERERIDYSWVLSTGLAGIDLVRSAHYHAVSFLLALKAGEPARIARGLALHGVMKSLEHADNVPEAEKHTSDAYELAASIGDTFSLGWAVAAQSVVAFGQFELDRALELGEEATALFRERSESTFREIGSIEVWFLLHALFLRGRLTEFATRAPACAREAEARGDRYTLSTVRAYALALHWAVLDRPSEGRREADAAIANWPEHGFYHQHWARLRALCLLDLYEGQGEAALRRVQEFRPRMKKAMQLRIRTPRIEFAYLEARGALHAWIVTSEPQPYEKVVRRFLLDLESERYPLADVYVLALRAGIKAMSDRAQGQRAFQAAAELSARFGMRLHEAAFRARAAECASEPAAQAAAEQDLETLGVVCPPRFVDMLAPVLAPMAAQ